MLKRIITIALILLLVLPSLEVAAQKQASVWYFGINAGLDFRSGKPVVLEDGELNTDEGCAAICDSTGKLLFYTDGNRVYRGDHITMENGTGLYGNYSATQSSIIVPDPAGGERYYIFTVPEAGNPNGLNYSVVDMKANGGKGKVVKKNEPLYAPTSERVTSVLHRNEKDYWVISHEWKNDVLVVHKVDENGVDKKALKFAIGRKQDNNIGYAGYLTVSPDGRRIAMAVRTPGIVEVFDFDNSTGTISNVIELDLPDLETVYGVSFSPDGNLLYAANIESKGKLYQYDLNAGDQVAINNSRYQVGADWGHYGALQIGPDGKIYVARYLKDTIAVIHDPNQLKGACNYEHLAIDLKSGRCRLGLPTLMQSYFFQSGIQAENFCEGEVTRFSLVNEKEVDSARWHFGDAASGADNFSDLLRPGHRFTKAGSYKVTVQVGRLNRITEYTKNIVISAPPVVDLGRDTFICPNTSFLLNAGNAPFLTWQDGSTGATYKVEAPGTYWVRAVSGTCIMWDTIVVRDQANIDGALGPDTVLCQGETLNLTAPPGADSIRWSDGSQGSQMQVSSAGTYWLEVFSRCGHSSDTIQVEFATPPQIAFPPDTILCEGSALSLNVQSQYAAYRWQNGAASPQFTIDAPGKYWVEVTNPCGVFSDTLIVKPLKIPIIHLGADTLLCLNDSIVLNAENPLAEYRWQDSSTGPVHTVKVPGRYFVTAINRCGSAEDDIVVDYEDCTCYLHMPDAFTPGNDTLNDVIRPAMCRTHHFNMVIYNRWGERIYETDDIREGWNGRVRGTEAPVDMYIYLITAQGINYEKYYRTGRFYLIR